MTESGRAAPARPIRRAIAGLFVLAAIGLAIVVAAFLASAGPPPNVAAAASGTLPPGPATGAPDARLPCRPRRHRRPRSRRRSSSRRPLTGRPVSPEVAARHPIAVMIDDHRRGPAAVGLQRGVGRLAGTGRGRDPALHADLPGQTCRPRRPGPQRPLLLHRLGRRVERGLRPRRRLARRRWRPSARRATASSSTTPTSSAGAAPTCRRIDGPRRAAQRLHGRQAPPRRSPRRSGRPTGRSGRPGSSRRTLAAAARPTGGDPRRSPTRYETITYRYDRGLEHLPPLRRPATSRRSTRPTASVVAPTNVVIMLMSLRAAQRRPPGQGPPRGRGRRHGRGLDLDERHGSSTGTWKKASVTGPTPLLRPRPASPVTLTVGQTFVQVMPTWLDAVAVSRGRSRRRRRHPPAASRARRRSARSRPQPAAADADLGVDRAASRAATSAQVRRVARAARRGRGRRAGGGPGRRPRSSRSADGQAVGVARLDEEPGRADDLRQGTDGRSRRPGSRRRSPRWPAGPAAVRERPAG